MPDFRGCFLRGYGTGTNRGTDVVSWVTSANIGVFQPPALPNITGQILGVKSTNPSYTVGAIQWIAANREGVYGSGLGAYGTFDLNANRQDITYARRDRDVAPPNYAVHFFIKF